MPCNGAGRMEPVLAHLIIGTVFAALAVWGLVAGWKLLGLIMRGVPLLLMFIGLMAITASCRRGER
jgi:hypothetical protein